MGKTYFTYTDNNYLIHYGVIGMKWGVRRYQNADGSLTSRGMKRYGTVGALNAANRVKQNVKNALSFKSYNIKSAVKNYKTEMKKSFDKRMEAKGSMVKRGATAAGLMLAGKVISIGSLGAATYLLANGKVGAATAISILGTYGGTLVSGIGVGKAVTTAGDAAYAIYKNKER